MYENSTNNIEWFGSEARVRGGNITVQHTVYNTIFTLYASLPYCSFACIFYHLHILEIGLSDAVLTYAFEALYAAAPENDCCRHDQWFSE